MKLSSIVIVIVLWTTTLLANTPPNGALQAVNANGVATGWASDPDTPNPIQIHLYLNAPAGAGGTFITWSVAGLANHGFAIALPPSLRDGQTHSLYAYAIDSTDVNFNRLLPGSPLSFNVASGLQTMSNGVIKVGVDLKAGGAITYIGTPTSSNYVNNFDHGRQIQLSVYDGSQAYDGCGGFCTGVHGWNPTQAGDKYGFASPVIAQTISPTLLYTKTRGNQWLPDDKGGGPGAPVLGDVEFEQWITFYGPTVPQAVQVHYKITHLGLDNHTFALQEVPAIYLNSEFNRVTYYGGSAPWTGGPLTTSTLPTLPNPHPWMTTLETWFTMINGSNTGMSILYPAHSPTFEGFHLNPCCGFPAFGGYGYATNYTLPSISFALGPAATFETDVFLAVGTAQSFRSSLYAVLGLPQPQGAFSRR